MKLFYRVGNLKTKQGLWYNMDGNFTGLIHKDYNFCSNANLEMPFDKNFTGYLSAVDNLEDLFSWFTIGDLRKLKKYGYRVLEYSAIDYKYYNGHFLINERTSVINRIVN